MNLLTTFAGSMMEGFLPRGWDLAQDRRLLRPAARLDRRAPTVVASRLRAGALRLGGRLRRDDGPRDRDGDQAVPRPGPAGRADPAGRPDGDVPLGGLFPQGVGRRVRPRLRLQHGRVERPRRRDPAARASRRVPERDAIGVLRSAGRSDRPRIAAMVRHGRPPAALRRTHRRAEGQGGRADRDLRHRPGLPHRLLGAPLRRGVSPASTSGRPRRTASVRGSIP